MHLLSTSAAEAMANKAACGSDQFSEELKLEQKGRLMLVCTCKDVQHLSLNPRYSCLFEWLKRAGGLETQCTEGP